MKGYFTRQSIQTNVDKAGDVCKYKKARYVYRYQYHAPDGSVTAFFQRPQEVPGTSQWSTPFNTCAEPVQVPAPEPNCYWSTEKNASLDTTNKCRPVIRWSDGSTEELHPASTESTLQAPVAEGTLFAQPFTPSCSAADDVSDLHVTDRNGNITTYRYTSTSETKID